MSAGSDRSVYRILDAELNRAREALRVIEDFARFACNDAHLAAIAKQERHALRHIASHLDDELLLDSRDVSGDVGRERPIAEETRRATTIDVVRAALGRLTEASRSICEYAKIQHLEAARLAEALRFRAYDLEQRIVLRGEPARRMAAVRLYVLITEAACRGDWRAAAHAVIEGGADCLQLREKALTDRILLDRARWLRGLTREAGVLLIINDRPDIARLSEADGVHVGEDDLSVAEARSVAGGRLLVGLSTHSAEQALAAGEADYVALGPMFASSTKPRDSIAGLDALRAIRDAVTPPLVVIGGITLENLDSLVAAGARRVCVCSAVLQASDPREMCRVLLSRLPVAEASSGVNEA